MYFLAKISVKYYMLNKKRLLALILLIAVCVSVPIMAAMRGAESNEQISQMTIISLWQVDSFEGGKGSRGQYLQNKAKKFFDDQNIYVTVTNLSADAVRANLSQGNIPDIISYGAGFYGLESYINAKDYAYRTWCNGAYCLITLDGNADFSDVNGDNTVINSGRDNLSDAAALFLNLSNAQRAQPTSAYVALINGKYKYLLGTQRDIFRFKTRGVTAYVKAVTAFNDLYQNISILTCDETKYTYCKDYINYVVENNGDADKVGMLAEGKKIYTDEMSALEGATYENVLKGLVSKDYRERIIEAVKNNDINLLKNLLK
jgi:hypothetical protein